MKRKIGMLMAAGLCALTLGGCSDNAADDKGAGADRLADIRARGKIVIAMEGTWAPWTYHDETGVLTGYDVEVGRKIAEKIGVKAEFVEGKWDGLLAGLDAGRYDLMINGVDVTPERAKVYDFSEPYAYNRMVVIVDGNRTDISSMADLKGKNTANTISSTYAEEAEKHGAKVTGVDDLNQTFELLLSGRIDATLNSEVTFYDYMRAHPDARIKIATVSDNVTEVAIPIRKGEATASLRAVVNETIRGMRESGELAALSKRFFGTDISAPAAKP